MVHFNRFFSLIAFSIVLVSCEPDAPPAKPEYPVLADAIIGIWRYDSIVVKGVTFVTATNDMLPGFSKADMGGARAELNRRMINYQNDANYQLIWDDRGDYILGPVDTKSWQPNFGFWEMSSSDTLIHNSQMSYEVVYEIVIDDNQLIRKHLRRMDQASIYGPGGLWNGGRSC